MPEVWSRLDLTEIPGVERKEPTPVKTIPYTCGECNQPKEMEVPDNWEETRIELGLPVVPTRVVCAECHATNVVKESKANARELRLTRASRWRTDPRLCPKDFHDTKVEKLPREDRSRVVLEWSFNPKGLLLHGPTRRGKTRTVWLLLERLFVEELRDIMAFDTQEWAKRLGKAFENRQAKEFLDQQIEAHVLFFDDLDKEPLTPRVQAELFYVLKRRIEKQRPTFYTTNAVGAELAAKFSDPNVGDPFVERLREYCLVVGF